MKTATIKSELHDIADHIADTATYEDAMYQLYVRMKIDKGLAASEAGDVAAHEDVVRRFNSE